MTNMNGVNRQYNAANQMTSDGTNSYDYDDNGNLWKTNTVVSHTWDRANRLLSHGGISYAYDGAGNRISQDTLKYLLDVQPGLTLVLGDSDGNHFVHGLRGIHAQEDNLGNWEYMAQDGLGSVRGLVDDAAVVQSSMSYDPYGNPMGSYGAGFGFTGEMTDSNGSVYLRARYYEPSLGVFSVLDPFEGRACTPMSLNRYGYVHGNPVMNTDPTGLICEGLNGTAGYYCRRYTKCSMATNQILEPQNFERGSSDDPCGVYWRKSGFAYVNCLRDNNLSQSVCPFGNYMGYQSGFSENLYGTRPPTICGGEGQGNAAGYLWEEVWGWHSQSQVSCDSIIGTTLGTVIGVTQVQVSSLVSDVSDELAGSLNEIYDYVGSNTNYSTDNLERLGAATVQVNRYVAIEEAATSALNVVAATDILARTKCYWDQGDREFAALFAAGETAKFIVSVLPGGVGVVLIINLALQPGAVFYSNLIAQGISEGLSPYTWGNAIVDQIPGGCITMPGTNICLNPFDFSP